MGAISYGSPNYYNYPQSVLTDYLGKKTYSSIPKVLQTPYLVD